MKKLYKNGKGAYKGRSSTHKEQHRQAAKITRQRELKASASVGAGFFVFKSHLAACYKLACLITPKENLT